MKKEGAENKCEFYAFLHIMIMSVIVQMLIQSRRCLSQTSEPCHQRSDRNLQLGRVKLMTEKEKLAETIIPSLMSKQIWAIVQPVEPLLPLEVILFESIQKPMDGKLEMSTV